VALFLSLGSLLAIAVWQWLRPRRELEFPALRRRIGNLAIWLANIITAALIFAPLDGSRPTWGLGTISGLIVGFCLLDLLSYAIHRCQHAVQLLWRLHALHHSDPDVDVTTAVRHHPIEFLIATAVFWLAVLVIGVPAWIAATHGIVVFALAAATHGNVRWPTWVERLLRPVVITLDLHLVHHSIEVDEANANFGAVFSVWDRLFGTYASVPRSEYDRLVFGVRELPGRDCLKPSFMLLTPWRLP
jgi:sterol desaturase/sphingolipid hydroxylase (fatty acid hydroxylase superfamily)